MKKYLKIVFIVLVLVAAIITAFLVKDKFNAKSIENISNKGEAVVEANVSSSTQNIENNQTQVELTNETTQSTSTNIIVESNNITNTNSTNNTTTDANTSQKTGKIVVIDPGHQRKGDNSKEQIGPGATETKAKVTTGATGVSTNQLESELNLKVSLLLKEELQKRGYNVIMTRTSQDINMSNSQRAEIANKAHADVFVRIHADSAESSKAVGMSTLCQTENNKYNGNLAEKSYKLSKIILDNMVKTTGAKSRGVTKTDNMSGINWANVPTTIIEMGFLSNPVEDKKLASKEYQTKIIKGIANCIDEYLK